MEGGVCNWQARKFPPANHCRVCDQSLWGVRSKASAATRILVSVSPIWCACEDVISMSLLLRLFSLYEELGNPYADSTGLQLKYLPATKMTKVQVWNGHRRDLSTDCPHVPPLAGYEVCWVACTPISRYWPEIPALSRSVSSEKKKSLNWQFLVKYRFWLKKSCLALVLTLLSLWDLIRSKYILTWLQAQYTL